MPSSEQHTHQHYRKTIPLFPGQSRILSDSIDAPKGSGVHIYQVLLELAYDIDIDRFVNAWVKVIKTHTSLRTFFPGNGCPSGQAVAPLDELNIEINDWHHLPQDRVDEYTSMFLNADKGLDFNLSQPFLFRISLLKTGINRFICLFSCHQAIADEKTLFFAIRDLFLFYQDQNKKPVGKPLINQADQMCQVDANESVSFWRDELKNYSSLLNLPFKYHILKQVKANRRRETGIALTTGNLTLHLPRQLCHSLSTLCRDHGVSMDFLFMGAWAVLISHYSGTNDLIFTVCRNIRQMKSNSAASESEHSGMLTNALPVRILLWPDQTIPELLKALQRKWAKTDKFTQTNLGDIESWFTENGNHLKSDIGFSFDQKNLDTALAPYKDKMGCRSVSLAERRPLSLFLKVRGTVPSYVSLSYDRRRFTSQMARQFLEHFSTFLTNLARSKSAMIMDIPVLPAEEKKTIFHELKTDHPFSPPSSCFHHLFTIQAASNPSRIAIQHPAPPVSYGQLLDLADKMACFLMQMGLSHQSRVMLLLDPDKLLVAALLGVLKSGGIYTIPDPMLADSHFFEILKKTDFIIASPTRRLPGQASQKTIILDSSTLGRIRELKCHQPAPKTLPDDIACRRYIPGPEGLRCIRLSHRELLAYAQSAIQVYDLQAEDLIFQSLLGPNGNNIEQLFPVLLAEAGMVLAPGTEPPRPSETINLISRTKTTVIQLPFSMWAQVTQAGAAIPESVRLIIMGPAPLHHSVLDTWPNLHAGLKIINSFGPPEAAGECFWTAFSPEANTFKTEPPVYTAFPNIRLCILNQHEQVAIPETTGGLYISGPQIAAEYAKEQSQTRLGFHTKKRISTEFQFLTTDFNAKLIPGQGIQFVTATGEPLFFNDIQHESKSVRNTPWPMLKKTSDPCPVILIGHSMNAAREYQKKTLSGHAFVHAPIFIHLYGKEGGESLSLDIPRLTQKCVQDISKSIPFGPCIIIGSCQNAIVAHEAALQLTQAGYIIELLVIIDENWGQTDIQHRGARKGVKKLTKVISEHSALTLMKIIGQKIANKFRKAYIAMDVYLERLYRMLGKQAPLAVQFRLMETQFYRICDANPYSPQPYDGKVLLLYSKDWEKIYNPKLHTFYTGDITKKTVMISHSEWFTPEQIDITIGWIDQCVKPNSPAAHTGTPKC